MSETLVILGGGTVRRGYCGRMLSTIGALRSRWRDLVLVLAVAAEALFVMLSSPPGPLARAQLALGALAGLAMLLRHRHWRWILPAVLVVNIAAWSFVVMVGATFCYALRSTSRARTIAVAVLAALGAEASIAVLVPHEALAWTLVSLLVVGSASLIGMYTRARRLLMAGLRERADEAEQRQAVAEENARRAERTRIAREMHDIVAHKISLVALQAGALEVNPNLERERVAESAALIRSTATEALDELRQVLGVLRGADDGAPLAPQPTWDDVRRLVDASREAGVEVDLYDFVDDPVPDALARTVYRVVQESLTNIHKHARRTAARVALIGEPGAELVVEVSNVLPQGFQTDLPGARMGLSGIETRVLHAGGAITSGPTDDGRFAVKAVIPWTSPVV